MKLLRRIFLALLLVLGLFLFYILGFICYATLTDFQAEERLSMEIENPVSQATIQDSTLSFLIWNIGYGGLGAKSDFFFDVGNMFHSKGAMVNSPKAYVEAYLEQQDAFFKRQQADFILLQEVDINSKRSHYINQMERFGALLPEHERTFAVNFEVDYIPVPILEPFNVIGRTHSGLASYARYHAQEATRLQLPGAFDWPKRIFQLDRCIGLHRYTVANGKELVVLNIHNSAYDQGGFLKKQQVDYLKQVLLAEYEKGNYVLAGGDWNQCPPHFQFDKFMPGRSGKYTQSNIPADFLPSGWTWAHDPNVPSNRKIPTKYIKGESFETLIDFFVLSPNLKLKRVQGIDLGFQASDHQPVFLEVVLN